MTVVGGSETPTTPIASATTGTRIDVRGVVVPSEEGVVRSPLTGRELVSCAIEVHDNDATENGAGRVHSSTDSRAFWVRDPERAPARPAASP